MTTTRTFRSYCESLPEGESTKLLSPGLTQVDMAQWASREQGLRADSAVQNIIPGFGVAVDGSDPQNPVVSLKGGAGLGTVVSVDVAAPDGMTAKGGPITDSGVIQLAWGEGYEPFETSLRERIGKSLTSDDTGLAAGKIPVLGLDGKIDVSTLPAVAIDNVFVVNSQAAMLALDAQTGDVAIRTDIDRSFMLATNNPGVLDDWKPIASGGAVLSVAGLTGAITATALKTALGLVYSDITDLNGMWRELLAIKYRTDLFDDIKQPATNISRGAVFVANQREAMDITNDRDVLTPATLDYVLKERLKGLGAMDYSRTGWVYVLATNFQKGTGEESVYIDIPITPVADYRKCKPEFVGGISNNTGILQPMLENSANTGDGVSAKVIAKLTSNSNLRLCSPWGSGSQAISGRWTVGAPS